MFGPFINSIFKKWNLWFYVDVMNRMTYFKYNNVYDKKKRFLNSEMLHNGLEN